MRIEKRAYIDIEELKNLLEREYKIKIDYIYFKSDKVVVVLENE